VRAVHESNNASELGHESYTIDDQVIVFLSIIWAIRYLNRPLLYYSIVGCLYNY